jgi:hypothetical protein
MHNDEQLDLIQQRVFSLSLPREYEPVPPAHFQPSQIYLAKGSMATPERRRFVERICSLYPEVRIENGLTRHIIGWNWVGEILSVFIRPGNTPLHSASYHQRCVSLKRQETHARITGTSLPMDSALTVAGIATWPELQALSSRPRSRYTLTYPKCYNKSISSREDK